MIEREFGFQGLRDPQTSSWVGENLGYAKTSKEGVRQNASKKSIAAEIFLSAHEEGLHWSD